MTFTNWHCLDNELDNWTINGLTRESSQGIGSKRVNVGTDHEINTTTVNVLTNFISECLFYRTDKITFDAK